MMSLDAVKINLFSIPLGLASQSMLWLSLGNGSLRIGTSLWDSFAKASAIIQNIFWYASMFALGVLVLLYGAKIVFARKQVQREWRHPILMNFFMMPFIATMMLGMSQPQYIIDALHPGTRVTQTFFIPIAALVFGLELKIYGIWLFELRNSMELVNPAYQVSIVGNFILASFGSNVRAADGTHDLPCQQTGLFFFSVGAMYQLIVLVSLYQKTPVHIDHAVEAMQAKLQPGLRPIMEREASVRSLPVHDGRLVVDDNPKMELNGVAEEDSLDETDSQSKHDFILGSQLHPIFFLMVAPPSAASLAWCQLFGSFDTVSRMLLFVALYFVIFFIRHHEFFFHGISFSVAWWAYSFPSAAIAAAMANYAGELQSRFLAWVALLMSLASILAVCGVSLLTVRAFTLALPQTKGPRQSAAAV
ncbi:unnamed protein product [Chrysoparadoxa australica]